MPAMRPQAISNRIRLSNEVAAPVLALVSEDGAVDSVLPAVINELSPYEHGVSAGCSKDDLLSRANEEFPLSPILVLIGRVVTFIEFKAVNVSVFCKPPNRGGHSCIPHVIPFYENITPCSITHIIP